MELEICTGHWFTTIHTLTTTCYVIVTIKSLEYYAPTRFVAHDTHEPQGEWEMIRRDLSQPQWTPKGLQLLNWNLKGKQNKTMSAMLPQT